MMPPRSEPATTRYPNNLPLQLNSFIGRERELAELKELVWSTRLLTLTGPGGSGKTRLALQLAGQLLDAFSDGVWFVDLAPLPETGSVPQAVAAVFTVHETTDRSFSAALIEYLRPRELLLVLDNCEHLLPACAELATALLRACPSLLILATSREALNIDGEVGWQTPPLSVIEAGPQVDPELLSTCESARLFLDRAVAVQPGFTPTRQNAPAIVQICQHLDGLPLAIELAAARVPALAVEQIAARLGDRFELLKLGRRTAHARHQTLRAMIDWSYGLLSPLEKKLFRRLAVFAGGWTLEAAEAVCSDAGSELRQEGETIQTLDALSRLVAKSLVIADRSHPEARFRFLETIHQYAQEKMEQFEETGGIRERHLDYFIQWTAETEPALIGPEGLVYLGCFEREHENIRTALDWGLSSDTLVEKALQLAVTAGQFFGLKGYLSEGREYLSAALPWDQTAKRNAMRAQGLAWMARLAFYQSDFPATHSLVEESLSIWRDLDLARSPRRAFALQILGEVLTEEGNYDPGRPLYAEALSIYREVNDKPRICGVLEMISWTAMRTGAFAEAEARFEESLALSRKIRSVLHTALSLAGLGELALRQGRYPRAFALLEESLALRKEHGDRWGAGTSLGSLGWAALLQGDFKRMRAALKESIAVRADIGDRSGIAWCLEKLAEGDLKEANISSAQAARERLRRAARLFGAGAAIRAPLGSVINSADLPGYERNLADLRKQLGQATFTSAWDEGQASITQGLQNALARLLAELETPGEVTIPTEEKPGGLTQREREVARLIVLGKSNRDIAQDLTVELKTVETHVNHIFNKLGFDSRVQIAVWAVEKGLAKPMENQG